MTNSPEVSPPEIYGARLPQLDALRGIAALMVVLHHAVLALPVEGGVLSMLERIPGTQVLVYGRPAVILFFVLSGYVLTLCVTPGRDSYVSFAAKRVVRLLPPYWCAMLVAFLAYTLVPHHRADTMSAWFNEQWGSGVPIVDAGRHFLMLAGPHQFPLDHVAWSLVHELRLSLVLPLMILLGARCGLPAVLAVAGVVWLGAEAFIASHAAAFPLGWHKYRFDAQGLGDSMVMTARFGFDFAIGVALATCRASIAAVLGRRSRLCCVVAVVGLAFLCHRHEAAMAVGAAMLIAVAVASRKFAAALDLGPLAWLGRVSYSLYLIHLPIMLTAGLLLEGILPPATRIAIAVALALPAAELMCRFVEAPSIRWSRAVASICRRGLPLGASALFNRAGTDSPEATGTANAAGTTPRVVA